MRFTKELKEKLLGLVRGVYLSEYNSVDAISIWLRKKGYVVIAQSKRINPRTNRWRFFPFDRDRKNVYLSLQTIGGRKNHGTKYWLEIPRDVAEKILVLEYLP